MYSRILGHAKAGLVVCMAIVAALAGTALAGSGAETSAITKSKVKRIVGKEVAKLAPTLHVASADTAGTADSAKSADTASTATSANTANSAQTAANADALGGDPAASFGSGLVFGSAVDFPAGNSGVGHTPYGVTGISTPTSGTPAVTPVAMTFRDFEGVGRGLAGNDVIEISLDSSVGGFGHPLCIVNASTPECDASGSFSIPENIQFQLVFVSSNLEGGEDVDFAYRLAP
jgi:hypothetical protein